MLHSSLRALLSSCSAFTVVGSAPRPVPAAAAVDPAARASPLLAKEKKDVLELEGVVLEVELDEMEQAIFAHVYSRRRPRYVREISPYDLTKGRITFRRR